METGDTEGIEQTGGYSRYSDDTSDQLGKGH